jgi:hypothetical protein
LEAYGIYWILIEYLRAQPGYCAPLALVEPLSRRYGSSKEKFDAVMRTYKLFEFDDENFWSESLMRRMQPLNDKRIYMKELAEKRWSKQNQLTENVSVNASALPAHSVRNAVAYADAMQVRVKKSKVNKSKEEENIKEFIASLPPSFLPVWEKWIEYKKKIKKPYKTAEGMKGKYEDLIALSGNNPDVAMKIVTQSIKEEWSGLFALKNISKKSTDEDPVAKGIRELKEIREREKLEKPV